MLLFTVLGTVAGGVLGRWVALGFGAGLARGGDGVLDGMTASLVGAIVPPV